jgi:NAD(P)-dependent dehydrogenase (short-subunit alcohol dehydrogenase family)
MAEATRRVALVTGVSRRQGIGFAIAKRLLEDGLSVMLHSWSPHDAAQPWAPPAGELDAVISELFGVRLDQQDGGARDSRWTSTNSAADGACHGGAAGCDGASCRVMPVRS